MNISLELVDQILNYLGTKPFVEVSGLINEIGKALNAARVPMPPVPAKEATSVKEKAPVVPVVVKSKKTKKTKLG